VGGGGEGGWAVGDEGEGSGVRGGGGGGWGETLASVEKPYTNLK